MSRSYHTKKLIPRDFFPSVPGEWVNPSDLSADYICLTAPWPEQSKDRPIRIDAPNLPLAVVGVYFKDGFVYMYDLAFPQVWSGMGVWLLNKVRGLSKGKSNGMI